MTAVEAYMANNNLHLKLGHLKLTLMKIRDEVADDRRNEKDKSTKIFYRGEEMGLREAIREIDRLMQEHQLIL